MNRMVTTSRGHRSEIIVLFQGVHSCESHGAEGIVVVDETFDCVVHPDNTSKRRILQVLSEAHPTLHNRRCEF